MTDPIDLSATPKPKKGGLFGLFGGGSNDKNATKANAPMSNGILGGLSASWSPEEAFCAILYATALVDGEVHPKEEEELRVVGHRVKIFEKKSDQEVDAILEKVRGKFKWDRKSEFPWSQVDGACTSLAKKNLGQTAFANACDIVFADRTIEQAEVDLLNRISGKLALDTSVANDIITVIKIKNGHDS